LVGTLFHSLEFLKSTRFGKTEEKTEGISCVEMDNSGVSEGIAEGDDGLEWSLLGRASSPGLSDCSSLVTFILFGARFVDCFWEVFFVDGLVDFFLLLLGSIVSSSSFNITGVDIFSLVSFNWSIWNAFCNKRC